MSNPVPEIFRPTSVVNLRIRLEEFNDTAALRGRLDPASPTAAGGPTVSPTRPGALTDSAAREEALLRLAELDGQILNLQQTGLEAYASDEDYEAAVRDLSAQRDELYNGLAAGVASGSEEVRPPGSIDGPAPDDRVALGGIMPLSFTVERNALRTADTATVTLNHSDAPFDPRLVRACAIEIVFGAIDPLQWERGTLGATRTDGTRLSVPERSYLGGGRGPKTTRFVGVVDTWSVKEDGQNGDTIELSCRDLSALLLDEPLRQGTGVDLSRPLDEAISAFLDSYASTRGTRVVWAGSGRAPIIGDATPSRVTRTRGGAQRQVRTGDQRMSLWDHVTEVCARVGFVPVFVDYELRILNPRTFYASTSVAKRMVYGRNLEHLEFSRKIGGVQVPTIEVRSFDPIIGRTRWARYPTPEGEIGCGIIGVTDPPARASRANVPLVSGHAPTERIATYLVSGIADPDTLRGVARSVFEQVGRQEIEGNFETSTMQSIDAFGDDPDLINIDAGTAVELLITRASFDTTITEGLTAAEIADLSRAARSDYLQRIGWSRAVADRFAELQENTAFQTVFRVQNVRISMDSDEGYKLAVDFVNYITARDEWGETTGRTQTDVDDQDLPPALDSEEEALRSRSDDAAAEYQRALQDRQYVTEQRARGEITEQDYIARSAELDEVVAQRRTAADEVP